MSSKLHTSAPEVFSTLLDQVDERIISVNEDLATLTINKRRLEYAIDISRSFASSKAAVNYEDNEQNISDDSAGEVGADDKFKHLDNILSLAKDIRTQRAKAQEKAKSSSIPTKVGSVEETPPLKAATYKQKTASTKPRRSTPLRQYVQQHSAATGSGRLQKQPSVELEHRHSDSEGIKIIAIELNTQLKLMASSHARQHPTTAKALNSAALHGALHSGCFRESFRAQMLFLSKLYGRPVIPRSVLYRVVSSSRNSATGPSSPVKGLQNVIIRLRDAFKTLIGSYERFLKLRIDKVRSGSLSPQDRIDIVSLWYRGQRLVGLYEHYAKKKRRLRCFCEHCNHRRQQAAMSADMLDACAQLVSPCPLMTPLRGLQQWIGAREAEHRGQRQRQLQEAQQARNRLEMAEHQEAIRISKIKRPPFHIDSKSEQPDEMASIASAAADNTVSCNAMNERGLAVLGKDWSRMSQQRVDDYHRAFQSRVKFIAESAVGRSNLRDIIKVLKHCCEAQADHKQAVSIPLGSTSREDEQFKLDDRKQDQAGDVVSDRLGLGDNREQFQYQWVQALKQYRLLYSLLVKEAHDAGNCFFLHK